MSVIARGGYQIIDGHETIFSETVTTVKIPGIFEAASNRYKKPCFFGNVSFIIDSQEVKVPWQLVLPKVDGTDIKIEFKDDDGTDNTLYISPNDELFAE